MQGTGSNDGGTSPTHPPRQSRIHSVGLPTGTSLFPQSPSTGNVIPPPIPRRFSDTPTKNRPTVPPPIPSRTPAIPKRNKNEKPITIQSTRQDNQSSTTSPTIWTPGESSKNTSQFPTPGNECTSTSVLPNSWKSQDSSDRFDEESHYTDSNIPNTSSALLYPWNTTESLSPDKIRSYDRRKYSDTAVLSSSIMRFSTNWDNDTDIPVPDEHSTRRRRKASEPITGFSVNDDKLIDFKDEFRFEPRPYDDDKNDHEIMERKNLQQLQKASRDLEKKLKERSVKTDEPKEKSQKRPPHNRQHLSKFMEEEIDGNEASSKVKSIKSRQDELSPNKKIVYREDDETSSTTTSKKFEAFSRLRREAELLAASRNLEHRLRPRTELESQTDCQIIHDIDVFQDMDKSKNSFQPVLKKPNDKLEKLPKATQTNLPPPLSAICQSPIPKPISVRQDSNVSSDSFSQTSSPSYTSKTMEAPLLPHKHVNGKLPDRALISEPDNQSTRPITKSTSTPASLQTIVKFHGSNNPSFHHRIIRDMASGHYVTGERLRFRIVQILINAFILLIIAGGLAAYFKNYPGYVVELSNKTIHAQAIEPPEPTRKIIEDKNPAPGICLPVIVSFCQYHKIPYNFTVFPNYMGNFGQRDAQHELELYDAVVDVRCYELAALFLCSVFVPKCGSRGNVVRPCRSLCFQTKTRCGFFLEVFGLTLPDYLECELFPDNPDPDECVGYKEVIEAAKKAEKPVCTSGFQCDKTRCISVDWRCDGHLDCADHSDELDCEECTSTTTISQNSKKLSTLTSNAMTKKSSLHCGESRCMSARHICDGVMDCPWGQDERNCLRLSEKNGDVGKGRLEVYHADKGKFMPACINFWEPTMANTICSLLGYTAVNSSTVLTKENNTTLLETSKPWRLAQKTKANLINQFQGCSDRKTYPTLEITCTEYACGRRRPVYSRAKARIVGGAESTPGDWPFLAALLGGPEQIFYCAGVLIADQWVLTASHCVGNHSDVSGWTIQLGITRRQTHTYLGQKLKVKRVVPHPNYNLGVAHDNDVALFQLENRVQFHEHLRPVCLPEASTRLPPGTLCTVIGWGKKEDTEGSEYEGAVNEVQVPVLSREVCNLWLEYKDLNVTDGMICAGYQDGGKDACQGDSGGPLLCQDENDKERWFVGGIVSWGIKCAHPKLPGVYAYVPKYIPWIRKEIEKYSGKDKG